VRVTSARASAFRRAERKLHGGNMMRIPRLRAFLCTTALAIGALPHAASAQLDHLVCYKAVDKIAVTASFDLLSELQPEFTAKGCRIVRVTDFCVPATKLNVTPAAADVRADIVGPPLYVDYVGYLVKCEQELAPSNKVVIDQFGTHRQGKYKIVKVYVPAKKGPPPCGTVNGTACGGVCPNAADECRIDAAGDCNCQPAEDNLCGGKPDKQGQCGGPCPDPTEQCQLTISSTGAKVCDCAPPPPPRCGFNAATGMCGGDCPNKADKCVLKSNTDCTCEPAETPCALQPGPAPTCGGDCPIAGDVCALDANDQCRCGPPPPSPCGQNPLTGTCGGDCPLATDVCRLDTTNNCTCGPQPCGGDATGQCSGACPSTGQQCTLVNGACSCSPPSCGITAVGTCGGECPIDTECRVVVGTNFCRCQSIAP
jgi:hypothetical protein